MRMGACRQTWVCADTKDGPRMVSACMVLALIDCKIFFSRKIFDVKLFWATASATHKNCNSMEREHCCLIVLLTMLTSVELSQLIGVGGWGWPISSRVSQKIVACLQLRN
jgi:hypothetical protein